MLNNKLNKNLKYLHICRSHKDTYKLWTEEKKYDVIKHNCLCTGMVSKANKKNVCVRLHGLQN